MGGFENALLSVQAYFYEVARAFHEAENLRVREHPAAQMHLEDAHAFNKVLRALLSEGIEPALNDKLQVVARFRGRPFNWIWMTEASASSTSKASGSQANRRPISSTRLRGLLSLMRDSWISW
jgi:hypothetical protein